MNIANFFQIWLTDIGQISAWKVLFLFIKDLTDFRKTVETRVDPRQILPLVY